MSTSKTTLRLRVTAAAETIVRGGHPWVFESSVREQNREGETGELAVIFDRKDKFLAVGLYDPHSPIRVRVLHSGKPLTIDASFWPRRFAETLQRRENLLGAETTGYRCINGESDGWPGLALDRYGETLVVKLYTTAWLPRLAELTPMLAGGKTLILRLSRNIQAYAAEHGNWRDGMALSGKLPEQPVEFLENRLRFEAEVVRGQKTGFFLDQRENRREVSTMATGRDVLNLFSFNGGFSVYAADGGARSVTSVDISEHALASANRNFTLNAHRPNVAQCHHETIQADIFDWLAKPSRKTYDLIILDPPSLAKRAAEREDAIGAYAKLISSSIARLGRSGTLVAASCSAHVSAEDFFATALECATRSGRKFTELKRTTHAPDHPATFTEAQYLKCIYLRENS